MKRRGWWLVTALVVGVPQMAWAVEAGLDARLAYYRWEEHVQPIAPLETGPMGLVGGWISGSPFRLDHALRFRGDFRVLLGYVNYDTALLNAPGVPRTTETLYLGSVQEISAGWRIQAAGGRLEPFVGLAYRWWVRSIQSNSTVTGYDEWYQTLAARLGVRGDLAVGDQTSVYWDLSGDPMLWAREAIDLEEIYGETLHVSNGRQLGWTIDVGIRKRAGDLGVFWHGVRLGQSNIVSCPIPPTYLCAQPTSSQDIIGVKATLNF